MDPNCNDIGPYSTSASYSYIMILPTKKGSNDFFDKHMVTYEKWNMYFLVFGGKIKVNRRCSLFENIQPVSYTHTS